MLLNNKCTSSENNIKRMESHAENEYVLMTIRSNVETGDNGYQVMHSAYANELGTLDCTKFPHPPKGQFKRVNIVALPTAARNVHNPTNNKTDQKARSNDATNQNRQTRKLASNNLKNPKSQEFQKQNNVSVDGLFVKQKDFKGDYYYLCGDNQIKNRPKVYEDLPEEKKNIAKQSNSSLRRTFSCRDTQVNHVQRIIPRRIAPPPPPHAKTINNFVQKSIGKKASISNLEPRFPIFEDLSQFSNHAAQLKQKAKTSRNRL